MPASLEVWTPEGARRVALEMPRVTIGRAVSNHVALTHDGRASRLHAVLERLPAGWCVRDLSSRNGTFLNGERVERDRPLRAGDEITVGGTRMVFRAERGGDAPEVTEAAERAPDLTPRERDVLLALFAPALSADVFTEPATTADMARSLAVSEAAIKQHLARLFDKFGVHGGAEGRRARLANEALRRGAVTLAEVRDAHRA